MWVFGAEKFLIFWRPPKTFLFVNYDLQNADLLWSYADRNSCRIRICFMGMWLPGTSWSKVTWLSNSADWAWLMKSTPKGPSPLRTPAPFLSSGSLQNVFSWNLQASEEMCMFLLSFLLFEVWCFPQNVIAYAVVYVCKSDLYLKSNTVKQKCLPSAFHLFKNAFPSSSCELL